MPTWTKSPLASRTIIGPPLSPWQILERSYLESAELGVGNWGGSFRGGKTGAVQA